MFGQNMFQDDDCKKIWVCSYCGEEVKKGQKYCSIHTTKKGREETLKENLKILEDLRKKGYCKDKILLPVA